MTCVLEGVTGISAVASHFQSILSVDLIANLEWPVLGRIPELGLLLLNFHPQSVRLETGQQINCVKTVRKGNRRVVRRQPSVGKAVNWSDGGLSQGPTRSRHRWIRTQLGSQTKPAASRNMSRQDVVEWWSSQRQTWLLADVTGAELLC